jgi:hypothetical protein
MKCVWTGGGEIENNVTKTGKCRRGRERKRKRSRRRKRR